MEYREYEIFTGVKFLVPEHIQRIDKLPTPTNGATHGWQLRYGQWTFYADRSADGSGAQGALDEATNELIRRIHILEAPTGLRKNPNGSKNSELPVGISGPIRRLRKGRKFSEFYFGITIPRFGIKPTNTSVYIATENTITDERLDTALAKAIGIRNKAEAAFQEASTLAKREKTPQNESHG